MSIINTGYFELSNNNLYDLLELYDFDNNMLNGQTIFITGYELSSGQDIGSFFTLYNSLGSAYTCQLGENSGYLLSDNTDIGSLFCKKNTVTIAQARYTGLLTIPSGCQGLYACKYVNNNYLGPIIGIRRSSDNAELDFYMDSSGSNVNTSPYGTGTSFSTWIGSNTAYVTKWYDQSNTGNHASQSNTTLQPIYNFSNKYIDFTGTKYFILPNGTVPNAVSLLPDGSTPTKNSSYTVTWKAPTLDSVVLSGGGNATKLRRYNIFRRLPSQNNFNNLFSTTEVFVSNSLFSEDNVVSFTYNNVDNTKNVYINSNLDNTENTIIPNALNTNNYIGYSNFNNNYYYLNGQLYYLCIFNNVLSSIDRNTIEQEIVV